jgi:hypothetical protein
MIAFDIPPIICDEIETTVRIILNSGQMCGVLEYIGGKRDGHMVLFGSKEIVDERGQLI